MKRIYKINTSILLSIAIANAGDNPISVKSAVYIEELHGPHSWGQKRSEIAERQDCTDQEENKLMTEAKKKYRERTDTSPKKGFDDIDTQGITSALRLCNPYVSPLGDSTSMPPEKPEILFKYGPSPC